MDQQTNQSFKGASPALHPIVQDGPNQKVAETKKNDSLFLTRAKEMIKRNEPRNKTGWILKRTAPNLTVHNQEDHNASRDPEDKEDTTKTFQFPPDSEDPTPEGIRRLMGNY